MYLIGVYMCMHVYVCMYVYIYIYIFTHIVAIVFHESLFPIRSNRSTISLFGANVVQEFNLDL